MSEHPHYRCDDEDHPVPIDLDFQGWFGDEPFRRYTCSGCGASYPESHLKGRPVRDPSFVVVPGLTSSRQPSCNSRRTVFLNDKLVGEIEYVSSRRKAPAGSPSSTGYVTHWGWRPVGSRIRNLLSRYEAECLVLEGTSK